MQKNLPIPWDASLKTGGIPIYPSIFKRSRQKLTMLLSLLLMVGAFTGLPISARASHGMATVSDIDHQGMGTFTGSYTHSGTDHVWVVFNAKAGEIININSNAAFQNYYWVYQAPDGCVEVGDQTPSCLNLRHQSGGNYVNSTVFTAPTTGQYTLQLDSFIGQSGTYSVTLSGSTAPTVLCAGSAPTFTARPADISANVNAANCKAVVNYTAAAAGSNFTYTFSGATTASGNGTGSGAAFNQGVTQVTLTAKSTCSGATSTHSFQVTVTDKTNPTITAPAAVTVAANSGGCTATGVVLGIPVTADNCALASVTNNSPATFPMGTSTVTWTVTDAAGNQATATQQVTVTDTEAPVVLQGSKSFYIAPGGATNGWAPWTYNFQDPLPAGAAVTGIDLTYTAVDQGWGGTGANSDMTVSGTYIGSGQLLHSSRTNTINFTGSIPGYVYGGNNTLQMFFWGYPGWQAHWQGGTITIHYGLPTLRGECTVTVTKVPTAQDACEGTITATTTDPLVYNTQGTHTITWTYTDSKGNASTQAQYVVIKDVTAPVLTIPADAVVSCTLGEPTMLATATDNCTAEPAITYSDDRSALNSIGLGLVKRTWTANDGNGNTTSLVQNITIQDTEAPVFANVPADITVGNDPGTCGAAVAWATPTATDNCQAPTLSSNLAPGATFPVGTTTVTYTARDAAGNETTASFTITVADREAPVATLATLPVLTGECAVTAVTVPTALDNCEGPITATTTDPLVYNTQGTHTITWTYTDSKGNASTQIQNVVIKDVTVPTIAAATAVTVSNDAGKCGAQVTLATPATDDNCGVASVTNDAPAFFPVGTTTVTWTVTDVNGLSATTTQTVTVNDTESPVAVAKNITVQLEANGTLTLSPAQVDNGSTDNCGIASLTLDKVAFDCANIGANPVVLTVTDLNGNVSTVSAVVTVEDKTAPTVLTRNLTIQLDATGNTPAITADQINNGSTDACGIASVTIDKTTFTCANAGANTVTLTVTDIHGNVGTATAIVTVQDVIAPVAQARKYHWVMIKNGTASVTAEQLNNGSSDVCGIASMTVSPATFSCDNIGANTVTLTVTDPSGNVSTATTTVYVLGVAPVAKIRVSKCEDKNCSGKHDHDDDDDDYDDDDDKDDDKWKNGKKDLATQLDPHTIYLGYGEQSMVLSAAASKGLSYGSTYSWTGNGPLSSITSARPRFTATAAGTYTFNVVVTNAFGCSAAASVTIKVIDVRCGNKVLVCHKGQQLCLPASAVKAHLAHGDLIGGCQTNAAPNARMAADFGQADAAGLTIYPNPMATRAQLEFVLAEAGQYRLEVYDMKGALVKVLGRGQAEAGNLQAYDLDATQLSEGVYLVKLVTDTQVITKRFVVKR